MIASLHWDTIAVALDPLEVRRITSDHGKMRNTAKACLEKKKHVLFCRRHSYVLYLRICVSGRGLQGVILRSNCAAEGGKERELKSVRHTRC